jgi:hypothetical protein
MTIKIYIEPTHHAVNRGPCYRARLGSPTGELIVESSTQPFLDAARVTAKHLSTRLDALEKQSPTGSRTLCFYAGWNEEMAASAGAEAERRAAPNDQVMLVSWLPPTER